MWSPRQVTHFQCRLVGYFTSLAKTPDRRDRRLLVSLPKDTGSRVIGIAKVPKQKVAADGFEPRTTWSPVQRSNPLGHHAPGECVRHTCAIHIGRCCRIWTGITFCQDRMWMCKFAGEMMHPPTATILTSWKPASLHGGNVAAVLAKPKSWVFDLSLFSKIMYKQLCKTYRIRPN